MTAKLCKNTAGLELSTRDLSVLGGAYDVAITKINNTTVVNFESSVAVSMNRIKVKMCLCIPVISSKMLRPLFKFPCS